MPYYAKSEDWLHQSALLLQARPSTTKITTRYHLKPARRIPNKPPKSTDDASSSQQQQQQPTQQQKETKTEGKDQKPPRGHLVLKTFDPASGVTLKYKTSKAAEVTRLVQMLGTLGRGMAGVSVPEPEPQGGQGLGQDEVMVDVGSGPVAGGEGEGSGVATPVGGGGGKGKKKKGKR